MINTKIEEELCDKAVADLTIKTPNLDVDAGTLSGGNQQKVCIARALTLEPDLLFVSERAVRRLYPEQYPCRRNGK